LARTESGQRKRERIGPNKSAADQRRGEVLTARIEGRYINKNPDTHTRFKTLAAWYLELPEVKAQGSYSRDQRSVSLLLPHSGDRVLSSEEYDNLLTHCLSSRKPIMKLANFTGMRLGEILGLTWGQVYLKGIH
jgi:integrase